MELVILIGLRLFLSLANFISEGLYFKNSLLSHNPVTISSTWLVNTTGTDIIIPVNTHWLGKTQEVFAKTTGTKKGSCESDILKDRDVEPRNGSKNLCQQCFLVCFVITRSQSRSKWIRRRVLVICRVKYVANSSRLESIVSLEWPTKALVHSYNV